MMVGKLKARAAARAWALALAACGTAHAAGLADAPRGLSAGRLGALTALVLGLAGVVIAGRAMRRAASHGDGGGRLRSATTAMLAGLTSTALGGLVVATADGGVGTGGGVGGAVLAMVLGMLAVTLGGVARARSRHAA